MPRQRAHPAGFDTKLRNIADVLNRPGMAGASRLGGRRRAGGDTRSVLFGSGDEDEAAGGVGQLLVLVASDAPIESGGALVPFGTVVAQEGFAETVAPGTTWVHPVAGVYVLDYEHAWAAHTDGGLVELLVDGVVTATIGQGSGAVGRGTIMYAAGAGSTGAIRVTQTSGSAQTCDATMYVAISDPIGAVVTAQLRETLWLDSRVASVTGTTVLEVGRPYTLHVDGNFRVHADSQVIHGSPQAVTYPSPGQPASVKAEMDVDTGFASKNPGSYPTHGGAVEFDLGSGWAHIEPDGGPFSAPQPSNDYTFSVVGQGAVVKARILDDLLTDNNGQLRIQVSS